MQLYKILNYIIDTFYKKERHYCVNCKYSEFLKFKNSTSDGSLCCNHTSNSITKIDFVNNERQTYCDPCKWHNKFGLCRHYILNNKNDDNNI